MLRLTRGPRGRTVLATAALSALAATGCSSDDDTPPSFPESTQPVNPGDPQDGASDSDLQPTDSENMNGTTGDGDMGGPSSEQTPDDLSLTPGDDGETGAAGNGDAPAEPGECVIPTLPTFNELTELRTLPDPFTRLNGERISTRAEWACRREEISQLAQRFIYGENPPAPQDVSGTVTNNNITVNVGNVSFSASINLPENANGPVPFMIAYGGGAFSNTFLQEGVAVINYNVDAVGGQFDRFPKTGAFHDANPGFEDTGNLVAWAWGVSRIIDIVEQSETQILDPEHVAVSGCSFAGKGAFLAGAFEERVDLTVPYESGMSGVPAYRMIAPEGAEVLRNAYEWQPWAGESYGNFLVLNATNQNDTAGRAADQQASGELMFRLPVDTHEVIGMVAPRGLLILGNPSIVNLAPRAERITALAGAEIYEALGVRDNISYTSNTGNGTHCAFRQEYVPLVQQNIRKFLLDDPNATTGTFDSAGQLDGQLSDNIAWETPVLQ